MPEDRCDGCVRCESQVSVRDPPDTVPTVYSDRHHQDGTPQRPTPADDGRGGREGGGR